MTTRTEKTVDTLGSGERKIGSIKNSKLPDFHQFIDKMDDRFTTQIEAGYYSHLENTHHLLRAAFRDGAVTVWRYYYVIMMFNPDKASRYSKEEEDTAYHQYIKYNWETYREFVENNITDREGFLKNVEDAFKSGMNNAAADMSMLFRDQEFRKELTDLKEKVNEMESWYDAATWFVLQHRVEDIERSTNHMKEILGFEKKQENNNE